MSADADSFNFFISFGGMITSTVIIISCLIMSFFFSMLESSVRSSGDLKHIDGFDEDNMIILPDSTEKTVEEALKKIPGKEPVYLVEEIPYYKK